MRPHASRPLEGRSNDAGFTMIEVLVAFAVLATLALAVQRGLSASIAATAKSEARMGAELVARALITVPLGNGPSGLQRRSGRVGSFQWQLRVEKVELPLAAVNVEDGQPPRWFPVRLLIGVSAPDGTEVEIEAIRLVRR